LAKKDNDSLTLEVETRLDDLFGDLGEFADDSVDDGFNGFKESPLRDLKAIVLSIDWEISDKIMTDFIKEVEKLKERYKSDEILVMFFKLLVSIGRYIRSKRASAHPDAIKLLISSYNSVEKVILEKGISGEEKKSILYNEATKFKKLKDQIAFAKAAALEKPKVRPSKAQEPKLVEPEMSKPKPAEVETTGFEPPETKSIDLGFDRLELAEAEPAKAKKAEIEPAESVITKEDLSEVEKLKEEQVDLELVEPESIEVEATEPEEVEMENVIQAGIDETPGEVPTKISGKEQTIFEEMGKIQGEPEGKLTASEIEGIAPHEAFAFAIDEIKQVIKAEFAALRAELKLWRQGK